MNKILPCECNTAGPDGIPDLLLGFNKVAIWNAIKATGNEIGGILTLTGNVLNGPAITGTDCIKVNSGSSPSASRVLSDASSYPNPFNPTTTIRYMLAEPSNVTVKIYNVTGQVIRTLVDEYQLSDEYHVEWDGKDSGFHPVPSGVYYARINTGAFKKALRLVLVK